jgi:4-hydroxybenzoate polyprenyltransferase
MSVSSVTSGAKLLGHIVLAMRPKQWTKNIILFAGLVFTRNLFDPAMLPRVAVAFAIFCAVSSAGYLVNDVLDVKRDRLHPTKRRRPIAAGEVTRTQALAAAVALGVPALAVATLLGWRFLALAAGYLALMLVYSRWLKEVVILDMLTVSIGFVIRAMAGAVAIDVAISPWLYLCTILLALFLVLGKRRHELVLLTDNASHHRQILREYSPPLLEAMMAVVTSSTIVAYSMYTFFAESLPPNHYMMATIPFVLYGVFRYLYLVYQKDEGGTPEELILKDAPLILDIGLWALAVLLIMYVIR